MRTAPARPDFRKRRETDFWNAVNRLLIVLIAVGGAIALALMFYPELRRIDEMTQTVERLEKERTGEELLLLQQQREEGWLKNDPEYVELLARERLQLMKDGETVFRLDAPALPLPAFPVDEPATGTE